MMNLLLYGMYVLCFVYNYVWWICCSMACMYSVLFTTTYDEFAGLWYVCTLFCLQLRMMNLLVYGMYVLCFVYNYVWWICWTMVCMYSVLLTTTCDEFAALWQVCTLFCLQLRMMNLLVYGMYVLCFVYNYVWWICCSMACMYSVLFTTTYDEFAGLWYVCTLFCLQLRMMNLLVYGMYVLCFVYNYVWWICWTMVCMYSVLLTTTCDEFAALWQVCTLCWVQLWSRPRMIYE